MWSWHGGWGRGGGWLLMTLMMVIFWGFVIWIVLNVVRRRPDGFAEPNRTPKDILDERLARGEIDEEEYRLRLHAIRPSRTDTTSNREET